MSRVLRALACGMTVVTLTACAPISNLASDEGKPVTPDEARQEVFALYDSMTEIVGGEWTEDTRTWGTCTLPDGNEGAQLLFLAIRAQQPLPANPREIAERARTLWHERGYMVEIETEETLPSRLILSAPAWLTGSNPEGRLLVFMVGDDYANFSAESRCVPGEAYGLAP